MVAKEYDFDEADPANEQLLRPERSSDDESMHEMQPRPRTRPGPRWLAGRLLRRRRLFVRSLVFAIRFVVLPFAALIAVVAIFFPSYSSPPAHYGRLEQRCQASNFAVGCANPNNEKVFISSILYDKDGHLSGGLWGKRLIELADLLGHDNVFLSIYESGSGPKGRAALAKFRERVPCRKSIVSEEAMSLSGLPNVTMPDGTTRTKRIAFLAELRNRALRPLDKFSGADGLVKYDKVMFLNDVSFQPMEAVHLILNTNAGPDGRPRYLAACALDFAHPWAMYDNYALRDAEGYAQYVNIFPFFNSKGRGESRAGIFAQTDAVRVKACWGGMMVVQGKYVQNLKEELPSPNFQSLQAHVIEPDKPANIEAPVRFRYEPEPYYDACESCLFPADVAAVATRERADETGMYVNPYVRTAYTEAILNWLPKARRVERLMTPLFTLFTWSMPNDVHPYRQVSEGDKFTEEMWDGENWQLKERRGRSGMFCGVREMQTLRRSQRKRGRNWWDTKMPPGQKLDFRTMWGEILPQDWRRKYDAASPEGKDNFFEFDRWNES